MASRPLASTLHQRLRSMRAVLLWLAMVMAVAQLVALRHGYSHSPSESASAAAGKHAGGLAHCPTCIVAAGIGGAAPVTSGVLLPAQAQQPLPLPILAAGQFALQHRPYAIRAPPSFAC
ncbi:MAG: hypothetical protein LH617_15080 [Ramlibacter sp.]|nr:hypothetical protein [Ramlibacter sp.]